MNAPQFIDFMSRGLSPGFPLVILVLSLAVAAIFAWVTRDNPSRRSFYTATLIVGVLPFVASAIFWIMDALFRFSPSLPGGILVIFLAFVGNPAAIGWWIGWGFAAIIARVLAIGRAD